MRRLRLRDTSIKPEYEASEASKNPKTIRSLRYSLHKAFGILQELFGDVQSANVLCVDDGIVA